MDPGDEGAFPAMSPADPAELTEELEDKQNALKQQGADAFEDRKLDVALEKFSEAIAVGCASALLYSRRAQLLMQLDRPHAAVNDCTAALEGNPDSGKAYKIRARAYAKLEMWEKANLDFQTGLKIDYDEQTEEDSVVAAAKAKELSTAAVKERVKAEEQEYHRKLQESKEAYEVGLRANDEKFREARMKEEEEKEETRAKENERKERVRTRAEEEKTTEAEAEPGSKL
ncbi:unnamed protein product [Polarella glacialis]|uniref:Uncharacterized protein n=1 Tax=Polarella glacialis TaxID=89957 RepID=A0A813KGW0_POLGL|nr:unnamed protein product [Polarella glacialis]